MVQFSGTLGSLDLPSLVKFLSDLGQTGTLELNQNGWSARMGLRDGNVVAAAFGEQRGLGAIMALSLVMKEAEFAYEEGPGPSEDELDLTLEQLREHMEPSPVRPRLGFDAVPWRVNTATSAADGEDRVVIKRAAVRKLLAVDGHRTVSEIIADGPLAESLRNLADLIDLGLISIDRDAVRDKIAATNGRTPGGNGVRDADRVGRAAQRLPAPLDVDPDVPRAQPPERPHQPERIDDAPHAAPRVLACPKLGFADDPASHFMRPTALHRCFATGSLKPVSTLEQRDLCLSGGYQACPRLRAVLGDNVPPLPARPRQFEGIPRLGAGRTPTDPTPQPDRAELNAWPAHSAPPQSEWDQPRAAGFPTGGDAAVYPDYPFAATPGNEVPAATPRPVKPTKGFPLLPAIAISLAIAAVLAWSFVLLRPRLTRVESPPAPTVVVTEGPAAADAPTAGPAPVVAQPAPTVAPSAAPTLVPTLAPAARTAVATQPTLARAATTNSTATSALLLDTQFLNSGSDWRQNPPFATLAGGTYRLYSAVAGRFVAVAAPLQTPAEDAMVSGTFRKIAGPPGGGYGLILRDQEPAKRDGSNQSGQFYVFEVGDRGEVGVWRRDENRWVDLLPWTVSDAVHAGTAPNELTARAVGSQLTFIVNGVQVFTQSDTTLGPGGVGLYTGGDLNDVAVDRFTATRADQ